VLQLVKNASLTKKPNGNHGRQRRATLPPVFNSLKLPVHQAGATQRQNVGTKAGNLCNASPAADGAPVMMALGAEVELSSADTARRVPLTEVVTGNRTTARQPNELVTAVLRASCGLAQCRDR
jgi:CO/xanthine dehydrogenase FAD-binding subunit